jgi:hypothetical protein
VKYHASLLWELMKKYEAHELVQAIRVSSFMGDLSKAITPDNPKKGEVIEGVKLCIEELVKCCNEAELKVSALEAESLLKSLPILHKIPSVGVGASIETSISNIARTIEREMSLRTYFSFDDGEAKAWCASEIFGVAVSDAFRSTEYELEEESKCYATGRYTAAAFHLMRVLEVGLSALADSIGCDPNNKSWETILKNIQTELNNLSLKNPEGWKETEKFYSEISAHFRNLKNAWRNYTMHLHEHYDRERVEEMYVHVRGLMKVLSSRIKERA